MHRFLSFVHYIGLMSICCTAVAAHPKSTPGAPGVVNYARSEYNAGTQNWAITQSKNGLIYFGNNKGLLEYDGSTWQLFPLPNRTIVRSLQFGPDNMLYVGGQNEFGYFSQDPGGRFRFRSLTAGIPEAHKDFEDVWKIFLHDDKVWFCSEKAVFAKGENSAEVVSPPGGRFENFFLVNGTLYFQDKSQGLFRVAGESLELVSNRSEFVRDRIVAMVPRRGGNVLVITALSGTLLMHEGTFTAEKTELSVFAAKHQAYGATVLEDGLIAMGTAQNGLVTADTTGQIIVHLNRDNGLQNNTILCIFQDARHNIWMGLDNGIAFAEVTAPFSFIGVESGIKGTGYASLVHGDRLYLGTNQGLYSAEWSDTETRRFEFSEVGNGSGQVWSINRLAGDVLVSRHRGAFVLENNAVKALSEKRGTWKFLELSAHPGYALSGTYTGFTLYRREAGKWKPVRTLDGFDESARVFEEDAEGYIWVSHAYKGLFKIALADDLSGIQEIVSYGSENGLPDKLFINVGKIRKELVFTTPYGIYRYNRLADRFEEHEDLHTILGANRNVHRLLEDETGNIWFSIDDEFGVLRFDKGPEGPEKLWFNQIQSSLVDGFEHVYAYNNRHVFIGTEEGFVHFDPSTDTDVGFPFGVVIRKVMSISEGDSVLYTGGYSDRAGAVPEYHYKLNDFRFDFTAPYFEENDRLRYKFKLDGFDKEWSDWAPRTAKEYTNLPQGTYTFSVVARNVYGAVSEEASYTFRVLPPWYATIYAKLIYFILGVAALFAFFRFISKREKKKTEIFKREQTRKLEQKEAEYKKEVERSEGEVIALRNEKLQADINHKTSQLASSTMHLVQKTEILTKLKEDLKKLNEEAPSDMKRKINQISRTIESDIQLDNNWEQFEIYFDQVHENFFKRLRQKFPELTPKDQKLCAYLRMNLTTKEIAPLLNISVRGVEISRYRVRKKLDLDSDTNLVAFIMDV